MTAHPDDILIVCWMEESRFYPQFKNSRVVNVASPEKLRGLRFRTAWVTGPAGRAYNARIWSVLECEAYFNEAKILSISEYEESA